MIDYGKAAPVIRGRVATFCSGCGKQLKTLSRLGDEDDDADTFFVRIDHECNYWQIKGTAKQEKGDG